jgi:hypothetical protein
MTSLRTPCAADPALAALTVPAEETASDPFAFGDFTWLDGTSLPRKNLFDSPIFTGEVIIDANYALSNQMRCPAWHQHRCRHLHVVCRPLHRHSNEDRGPTSSSLKSDHRAWLVRFQ